MRLIYFITAITAFSFLTGCGTTPLSTNYAPSSLIQGKGNIHVDIFRYLPAELGKSQPNQIKNTALGQILIAEDVGKYLSDAFASEFKYAGYTLDNSKSTIKGEIEEFTADDLGFSVDWTLKLKVLLTDKSGKISETRNLLVKKNTQKFGDFNPSLNMIVKAAFEQLMSDPKFKNQIH